MIRKIQTSLAVVASCLLAGCGGPSEGEAPPKTAPLTEQQLSSMPAEAKQGAENANRAGNFQAQRMQEMAEAQKRAQQGGQ